MNQYQKRQVHLDLPLLVAVAVLTVLVLTVAVQCGRWKDTAHDRAKQIDFIQHQCHANPDGSATCDKNTFVLDTRIKHG